MLTVFEVTLPVFGLVFCGWIAARRRMLSDEAVGGINAFVFWFALPAMLFRAVAAHPVSQIADARFLSAYALAGLMMFFGGRWVAGLGSRDPSARTAYALTVTHGNIGYLGLPLLVQLGDPSRVPALVMAMLVDIFIVILMSIALFEIDRGRRAAVANSTRTALSQLAGIRLAVIGLLRSPLILGIGGGLAFSVLDLSLPPVADSFTALLAAAAGPCALFAIGASLGGRAIAIDRTITGMMSIKLVVHPALVAAMMFALQVDPRAAAIGVLAASLPAASNSFILAQRYGVDTRAISASIIVGTFAAAVTVTVVIWLLGLLG
jgi:malonate transporter and related proteins